MAVLPLGYLLNLAVERLVAHSQLRHVTFRLLDLPQLLCRYECLLKVTGRWLATWQTELMFVHSAVEGELDWFDFEVYLLGLPAWGPRLGLFAVTL